MNKSKSVISGIAVMLALCGCGNQDADSMQTFMQDLYGENKIIESDYNFSFLLSDEGNFRSV